MRPGRTPPGAAQAELPPEYVPPIDAVAAPVDRARGLRGVPRVTGEAIGVVWRAAPRLLAASIALQLASAVLVGVQLYIVKGLVGGLVDLARDRRVSADTVAPSLGALLAATVALGFVSALTALQQRLLAERVARSTLDEIIDVASTVELARFEDSVFHDQLERATAAATFRPLEMVNSLMTLLLGLLTSAGIIFALATLEPLLVPMVLLAGIPALVATLHNSRQAYAFEYAMTSHARERLHLVELFTDRDSAKELRVFDAAPFLRRRFDALSDERIRRMEVFVKARLKVSLIGTCAGALGTGIALGSLVWLLSSDRIGISTAAAAAVAMQLLAGRLNGLTSSVGTLVESGMFLDDLNAFFLLTGRRGRPGSDVVKPEPVAFDQLEVHGLSFTYPGTTRRVLDDVSMEIRRGEVVALVGENGSGKTTLVKLLCRLYDVEDGEIHWNGRPAEEFADGALRGDTTVLFQDFVRYHLSVADNIALGRSDIPATPEGIAQAARRAGVEPIVDRLSHRYETRLGRQFLGGAELSGGEWQRLALARAFYRGGGLLIMDEPTAALDPRAESELFAQMRELAAGKAVLLTSHRFANVKTADRIYVLSGGRVVESGDHDQLMRRDGLYAELFRLQAAAYVGS